MKAHSLEIAAELKNIAALHRFIESSARDLSIYDEDVFDLRLAVEEVVTNTINHGYRGRKGGIRIEISRKNNTVTIQLRDRAEDFNPAAFPPTDPEAPLSERPAGGRGLLLLRESVDEIRHASAEGGGNHLTLKKRLTGLSIAQDPAASPER